MVRLLVALTLLFALTVSTAAQTPEAPIYSIQDGALYADVGAGATQVVSFNESPELENVVYTDFFVDPTNPAKVIVAGYINDETQNFVLRTVSYGRERYRTVTTVFQNSVFGGGIVFSELGTYAYSAVINPQGEDWLFPDYEDKAAIYYLTGDSLLPLTPPLDYVTEEDGTFTLPTLISFADTRPFSTTVETIDGETLDFHSDEFDIAFPTDAPLASVVFADTTDTSKTYATIGTHTIPMPLIGSLAYIPSLMTEGTRQVYATIQMDGESRYDRLYLIDKQPLKVTLLLTWGGVVGESTDPILEGDTAITPDGQNVFFSAYNDELGATLWRIDLSAETLEPVMLADGLPFLADAGNFALAKFVQIDNETFTVEIVGGATGQEFRTYSLDGEFLDVSQTPPATATPTP